MNENRILHPLVPVHPMAKELNFDTFETQIDSKGLVVLGKMIPE